MLLFSIARQSVARKLKASPRVGRNLQFERRNLGKGKGSFGRSQGVADVGAQGYSSVDGQDFSTVGLLGKGKGSSRSFAVNGGTFLVANPFSLIFLREKHSP